MSITTILNDLDQQGVFAYVLPFLLIFAVVFAILRKSGILSKVTGETVGEDGKKKKQTEDNNAILAIIAASVALLSLQYDVVSVFFAQIFPKLGVGISILLVFLILGAFVFPDYANNNKIKWLGFVIGGILIIWAMIDWNSWFGYGSGLGYWFYGEDIWTLIILVIVGVVIYLITKK